MNKNLQNLCDKARFVSTPDYPDQDVVFERFARNLTIEIIGRIYRHFPESEEAEKLWVRLGLSGSNDPLNVLDAGQHGAVS